MSHNSNIDKNTQNWVILLLTKNDNFITKSITLQSQGYIQMLFSKEPQWIVELKTVYFIWII